MNELSIAVVVTALNEEAYICDALDSIAAQSRLPDQTIFVDDGSSDTTTEQVRKWKSARGFDVQILQQTHLGISSARNAGIRQTDTSLIAFLDGDDLFTPQHLARLEQEFLRHPELILFFTDVSTFDEMGTVQSSFLAGKPIEAVAYDETPTGTRLLRGSLYSSLINGCFITVSSAGVRMEALKDTDCFDNTLRTSEDRDFFLRLSRVGNVGYIPVIGALKRLHSASLTASTSSLRISNCQLQVLEKMINSADELLLSPEEQRLTRESIAKLAVSMIYAARRDSWIAFASTLLKLLAKGYLPPSQFIAMVATGLVSRIGHMTGQ